MSVKEEDKEVYDLTISSDDKIIALISANTRYTGYSKSTANVLKVLTLIAHGTPKMRACKVTGISIHTLNKWAREDWYNEIMELIRGKLDQELDASFTGVIHKAASEAYERLEYGDLVWKDGELVRKPVSAREAMLIAGIAYDKRALQRGRPTSISESVSTEDRLEQLAQKFREMASIEGTHEVISCEEED